MSAALWFAMAMPSTSIPASAFSEAVMSVTPTPTTAAAAVSVSPAG
jgi:hypothetical protein